MKQKAIHFSLLFLLFFLPILGKNQTETISREKEKIMLQQLISGHLRSVSLVQPEVYYDGDTIDLYIDNYSGPVEVVIYPLTECYSCDVTLGRPLSIDISQLKKDSQYVLHIIIDNTVFKGKFQL